MKILMLRHGATPGNLEKRYVGRTDEGLTAQAVLDLGERAPDLQRLAGSVSAIAMSPKKRCLETAAVLFPEELYPSVPRLTHDGLQECNFGKFEYKNYWELSGNDEYQYFIDTMGKEGFPGGETTVAFKARTVLAFRDMMREITLRGTDREQTVVFVVHGGTIMAVMEACSKEQKGYYDWQVGNGQGMFCEIYEPDGMIEHARMI